MSRLPRLWIPPEHTDTQQMTDDDVQSYMTAARHRRDLINKVIPLPLWKEMATQDERLEKDYNPRAGKEGQEGTDGTEEPEGKRRAIDEHTASSSPEEMEEDQDTPPPKGEGVMILSEAKGAQRLEVIALLREYEEDPRKPPLWVVVPTAWILRHVERTPVVRLMGHRQR